MRRLFYFLRYGLIFVREVIIANYQLAKIVVTPTLRIRPGFLAVPIRSETDFEITSLANSITLTPGTITVHVSDDRKTLVIHAIDVPDPDAMRRQISKTLEDNILKWTRPTPGLDAGTPGQGERRDREGDQGGEQR